MIHRSTMAAAAGRRDSGVAETPLYTYAYTTDWHINTEVAYWTGGSQAKVEALVTQIANSGYDFCIATGDMAHQYGATENQADLEDVLAWLINKSATLGMTLYVVRGNHDELENFSTEASNDFTAYDATIGGDYDLAFTDASGLIRHILLHSEINHAGTANVGFAHLGSSTISFLTSELDALNGLKAIVYTHFPLAQSAGNYIYKPDTAATDGYLLNQLLIAHSSEVIAFINGHRHPTNTVVYVQDGITHLNSVCVAYGAGNTDGGYSDIRVFSDRIEVRQYSARTPFGYYASEGVITVYY